MYLWCSITFGDLYSKSGLQWPLSPVIYLDSSRASTFYVNLSRVTTCLMWPNINFSFTLSNI